ncbi:hypothetical protein [Burkholderia pseudomallei]|uniref:hypothetical protein n=1 Tax=Burkholderia pseudomallei TaxID=28450 RepID=UPI0005383F42|nr:hypothetical protein [Burkholderia pseudomallei]AJX24193.1 hypothetical protein BG17_1362 [Burkholderia pseudomallei MSHR491]KGW82882.1 hypothetical protein Y034_790 [Burkholderia pseudomallei MSHR449]KGX74342.1 hypothetical protein Y033_655 [Burkholderia pseudomallei MSHR435]
MDANLVVSAAHAASAVVAGSLNIAPSAVAGGIHAASSVASGEDTFPCLGVKALGLCQYNPLKPNNTYLTPGDALAALGLVIAFLQLGTPTVRLRNRIRARVIRVAFALFLPVFAFTCYAALIPSLYSTPPQLPFGYPVVWELAGALCGLVAFGTVAFSYFWPTKFSRRNAREFAQACTHTLAAGDTDALRALSVEVAHNAASLVRAASVGLVTAHQKRTPVEYEQVAYQLLQMLSDRRFCRVVVESSPGTFIALVKELKGHHADRDVAKSLLRELSASAILSDDSILEKEEQYAGLGHYGAFTRAVYGDYGFSKNRLELFNGWKSYQTENVTRGSTERYCRAVRALVNGYFEHKDFYGYPTALYHAFENLWQVFRSQMWELRGVSDDGAYRTQAYKIASTIADTYGDVFDLIVKHQEALPTDYHEANAQHPTLGDTSIYAVYAKASFELVEAAAADRGHDESLRLMLFDVYERIDGKLAEDGPAVAEIQRRVRTLLTEKLRENMVDGYYPFVSRPLCYLVGVWDARDVPDDDVRISFMTRAFHDALREYFWSAYLVDAEKAMDLLAGEVTFNGDTGELIRSNRVGQASVMKLERPTQPLEDTTRNFARIKPSG